MAGHTAGFNCGSFVFCTGKTNITKTQKNRSSDKTLKRIVYHLDQLSRYRAVLQSDRADNPPPVPPMAGAGVPPLGGAAAAAVGASGPSPSAPSSASGSAHSGGAGSSSGGGASVSASGGNSGASSSAAPAGSGGSHGAAPSCSNSAPQRNAALSHFRAMIAQGTSRFTWFHYTKMPLGG